MVDRGFPEVKFDWLGGLPDVMHKARTRAAEQATLADFSVDDANSAQAMMKKGAQLMAAGAFDTGLKMYNAGREKYSVDVREKELGAWRQGQGTATVKDPGTPLASPDRVAPGSSWPARQPRDAQGNPIPDPDAPAPGGDNWGPAVIPPRGGPPSPLLGPVPGGADAGQLLGGPQMAFSSQPGPAPGPPMLPIAPGQTPPIRGPYPHEPFPGIGPGKPGERIGGAPPPDMIERAQAAMAGGPGPMAPPGPQMAALGPPMGAVEPPPVPPGPQMVQAGPAPAIPGGMLPAPAAELLRRPGPLVAPQGGGGGTVIRPAGPRTITTDPELIAEIQRVATEMNNTNPKAGGRLQQLRVRMNSLINRVDSWKQEDKDYMLDQSDRAAEGLREQNRSEWKLEQNVGPKRWEAADKQLQKYQDDDQKAQTIGQHLRVMNAISRNKDFIQGEPAATIVKKGAAAVGGILDLADQLGINTSRIVPDRSKIPGMKGAALADVFDALASHTVLATVGSLGNQISEGDRGFVVKAFPSLAGTKEGTQMLIEIMDMAAKRATAAGNVARAYGNRRGVRITREELNQAVKDDAERNPILVSKDGKIMKGLGQKVADYIAKGGELVEEPAKAAGPAAVEPAEDPGRDYTLGGKTFRQFKDGRPDIEIPTPAKGGI